MPPLAFDVCIIKWVEAFTERGNGCSTAADDMQVWLYLYNFFGAAICQNRPTCGCNTYLGVCVCVYFVTSQISIQKYFSGYENSKVV